MRHHCLTGLLKEERRFVYCQMICKESKDKRKKIRVREEREKKPDMVVLFTIYIRGRKQQT